MIDFNSELKRAEGEMRSGSLDTAVDILRSLRSILLDDTQSSGLDPSDRNRWIVKISNNLGVVLKNQGEFEKAVECLEEALKTSELITDSAIKIRTGILSNLGLLYSRMKKYQAALNAFDKAIELALSHPKDFNKNLLVKLYNNRALFFVRFGEPDRARDELSQALTLESDDDRIINGTDPERESWLAANLGMIHAELGDEEIYDQARQDELYRQARTMFMHSADLYGQKGYLYHRIKQIVNAAEINIRLKSPEEAKRNLAEANFEARRLKDTRAICEIAHVNVELALLIGNRDQIHAKVREAVKAINSSCLPDISLRMAHLEGVLRRSGQKDAVDIIAESCRVKEQGRDAHQRATP